MANHACALSAHTIMMFCRNERCVAETATEYCNRSHYWVESYSSPTYNFLGTIIRHILRGAVAKGCTRKRQRAASTVQSTMHETIKQRLNIFQSQCRDEDVSLEFHMTVNEKTYKIKMGSHTKALCYEVGVESIIFAANLNNELAVWDLGSICPR